MKKKQWKKVKNLSLANLVTQQKIIHQNRKEQSATLAQNKTHSYTINLSNYTKTDWITSCDWRVQMEDNGVFNICKMPDLIEQTKNIKSI